MAQTQGGIFALPLDEQRRGFCAILSKKGTQSLCSPNLEDFKLLIDNGSIAWVDYIVEDFQKEATDTASKLGFSHLLVERLLMNIKGGYEDMETEIGLLLPAIQAKRFSITAEPLLILCRNSIILTIHTRERSRFFQMRRYAETFFRKLPQDMNQIDWLTLVLIRIIDENNSWNFKQLQEIDEGSDDLTRDLKSDTVVRSLVGDQIYQMKHALLQYLSALWSTADTLSSLRHGDAELISDNPRVLEGIASLLGEVHQQLSLAEHLAEVLASGLECLQSIYNNQLQDRNNQLQDLNNRLQDRNNELQDFNNQLQSHNNQLQDFNNKLTARNNQLTATNNRITLLGAFLAIIGAGFVVPNTIATVFSQTNIFQLHPGDMGWYLALILSSTIIATTLVWLWVKKKGLLPKPDEDQPIEGRPLPSS